MKSKRGLSTVVTTLIIILLVMVAVGVVWVVIANIISEGTEQVSLGKFTLDLKVKNVQVNENTIDVEVKRNSGDGELSGLKFIVSDGVNTQVFEEQTTMLELAENTFTLNYTDLVKDVSIAPILKSGSGKDIIGNEIDKLEFSNKQIIENLGAVSWWRFEGNAQDEVGSNNGVLNGGVDCNVDGKFGKGCEFDGFDDYIDVGNNTGDYINNFSIFSWFKTSDINVRPAISRRFSSGTQYDIFISASKGALTFFTSSSYSGTSNVSDNNWHLGVIVINGGDSHIYIDGVSEVVFNNPIITQISTNTNIGAFNNGLSGNFKGIIDEPMIFNKALSENEIKALYKLDLR